jgi:hypothetical protein
MTLPRLTTVRLYGGEADHALEQYIFGGLFSGARVPRGIKPEQVSEFINNHLKKDSSSSAYDHALQVMRFYESADVISHVLEPLSVKETDLDSLLRSAYVLQAAVEFGTEDVPAKACEYFDHYLVNHKDTINAIPQLLDTVIVLAPLGSVDKLAGRIKDEVKKAEEAVSDEQTMAYYDKLVAFERNDLPRAQATIKRKLEIMSQEGDVQIAQWIAVYLGLADISDNYTEVWAGRLLRKAVLENRGQPVLDGFAKMINNIIAGGVSGPQVDFVVERAAQAIMYLGGELSPPQKAAYDKIGVGGMHFLWDDLRV